MKKEWIMTEEEKQKKKQKIEENRARKMGELPATTSQEDVNTTTSSVTAFYSTSPSFSTTESTKPQAIVVGTVRNEEDSLHATKVIF